MIRSLAGVYLENLTFFVSASSFLVVVSGLSLSIVCTITDLETALSTGSSNPPWSFTRS